MSALNGFNTVLPGIDGPYDPTDTGNAQRVWERHGENFRFVARLRYWVVWDEVRWARDEEQRVERFVVETARELKRHAAELADEAATRSVSAQLFQHAVRWQNDPEIRRTLARLRAIAGSTVFPEQLDSDPMLLGCRNGVVDLRTGECRDGRREDWIARQAPVVFDPAAECPTWESVLSRAMDRDPELIAYLQRLFGLCLTGDSTVQEVFILHGAGDNGKSKICEAIMEMLGPYAGLGAETLLTSQQREHPTEVADLWGKRAVFFSETEKGARFRVQMLKRLTGDGRLKGRFMRGDFIEFDRTHKSILLTNTKPRIDEQTHATRRRIRLIPFNVVIPPGEQDRKLGERLKAEWPGILAWCIKGCLQWQQDGMNPPAKVLLATSEYLQEQDVFARYQAERLTPGNDYNVTRSELLADFHQWCEANGILDLLKVHELYDRMRSLPEVQHHGEHNVRRQGRQPERAFHGIGLKIKAG